MPDETRRLAPSMLSTKPGSAQANEDHLLASATAFATKTMDHGGAAGSGAGQRCMPVPGSLSATRRFVRPEKVGGNHLPPELLEKIIRMMQGDDFFDEFKSLSRLSQAWPRVGHMIEGRSDLKQRYEAQNKMLGGAQLVWGAGVAIDWPIGGMLSCFSPAQRHELFMRMVASPASDAERVMGLSTLCTGWSVFSSSHQQGIVQQACALRDPQAFAQGVRALCRPEVPLEAHHYDDVLCALGQCSDQKAKSQALEAMIGVLGRLSAPQREHLVQQIHELDDNLIHNVLARLAHVYDALPVDERSQCFDILQSIYDHPQASQANREAIVSGLASHVRELTPLQAESVVHMASAPVEEDARARMLGLLAPGLGALHPAQKSQLLQALSWLGSNAARVTVLQAWAPQAEHFSPVQRQELLQMALNVPQQDARAKAIAAFGASVAHLAPSLREILLQESLQLGHERDQARALGGLAEGLGHFTPQQRLQCMEKIQSCREDDHRALMTPSLGRNLQHLSADQRAVLVNLALDCDEETDRWDMVKDLGQGMAHLGQESRGAIVHAVLNTEEDYTTTQAVQAVAPTLKDLPPDQRALVIDRALAIPGEHDQAGALAALGREWSCLERAQQTRWQHAVARMFSPEFQDMAMLELVAGVTHDAATLPD